MRSETIFVERQLCTFHLLSNDFIMKILEKQHRHIAILKGMVKKKKEFKYLRVSCANEVEMLSIILMYFCIKHDGKYRLF